MLVLIDTDTWRHKIQRPLGTQSEHARCHVCLAILINRKSETRAKVNLNKYSEESANRFNPMALHR
jgi:hypothetical protein